MDKVIPILPCRDIKAQVAFYESLGFTLKSVYTSPSPYAVLELGEIELHFYGSKKMEPAHNASMCFVKVDDVDAVYNSFVSNLKERTGKIPRSGAPKITKVRDLASDRRFTLTDTGGNTFYIGTPVQEGDTNFFRTLENEKWAAKFAVLYDLLHSKEDPALAGNMLPKLLAANDELSGLDNAKLLILAVEIQRQQGEPVDDAPLKKLLKDNKRSGEDWKRIEKKYDAVLSED